MDENKKLTPEEIEELIKSGEITEDELEKISGGTGMDYIQYLHLKKKRTYDKDD
ncbi:MAG: ArsR family transcriptional regulator [Ruminococcus sp.]|nr:ArsR family transcriptional regulator [Ruminococcus sp.]